MFPFAPLRNVFFLLLLAVGSLAAQHIHTCTVIPATPAPAGAFASPRLPSGVQKAVSYKPSGIQSNNWTPGTAVTVKFLGGSSTLQGRVMRYAREWTQYANLDLRVVSTGWADIRISFTQNGSSWSMVGRSSAQANQNAPSMNFGWLTDETPDYEVRRTVLHEFGHALGLLHEHQNPAGGIPWDQEAVYAYYLRTQGWDRNTTYHNVMATASHDNTQYSAYDAASIMHYPVAAELTGGRYAVGMNNELSTTDKFYISQLYPGRAATNVAGTTTSTAPAAAPPRPATRPTTLQPRKINHAVRISNSLGEQQSAETVELYVAERRYVIELNRNGRTRQDLTLRLPAGQYRYRVVTKSTYRGYRVVEHNGHQYRKAFTRDIPGGGTGTLDVNDNLELIFYGDYDAQTDRLNVYLGQAK